jgi:hypothetical protein
MDGQDLSVGAAILIAMGIARVMPEQGTGPA